MNKIRFSVLLALVGVFVLPRLVEGRTIRVPADYPTIQAGINAASSGDTVLVAAGTYHENNVDMKKGVVIKGAGIDTSIVDGDGETVFWGADDAIIEGFTINNASGNYERGIFCWSTTPVIYNNKITNCYNGISVADNAVIRNNIIVNNSGSGIFCGSSTPDNSPQIMRNLIVNNNSDGITSVSSDIIAINNTIDKNSYAGVWVQKSSNDVTPVAVTTTNNIITNNSRYGVYLASGDPYGVDPSYMIITYNDVWNNSLNYRNWSPDPSDISADPLFAGPGLSSSLLEKGRYKVFEVAEIIKRNNVLNAIYHAENEEFLNRKLNKSTENNFSLVNEFIPNVDIKSSDYYLQPGSPCIDAGDPNSSLDPDGTRADMGAFYYNQSTAVDPAKTLVIANPDTIPADGISISTITVIPRDPLGNNLGADQTVVLATTAGTLLGSVSDNGDGTYTQKLRSSTTPGTAIITARVNGIEMNQKPVVVFISTVAVGVRIDPPNVNIGIGETFTVDVLIDNATNLGSFQFDIEFSTSVVHVDTAWLGSFLGSTGRTVTPLGPTIDNNSDPGKVIFSGFSFGTANGPNGSGILARVKFTSQDTGSTILDLQNVQLTDINGQGQSEGVIKDSKVVVTAPSLPIFPTASSPQFVGDEFLVDINVGDTNNTVSNLFGVSFDLNFSQTNFIDVVTPHPSNVIPGDFMGSDVVFIQSVDEATGKVSIGITRKAGQGGVSGHGIIAKVKYIASAETPHGTQVIFSITDLNATDSKGTSIPMNPYDLIITLNSGVIVWPGDTNNNGIVNQADVLPIGLYWNQTGIPRQNASNAWNGQPATPWPNLVSTFADADGNGVVNQADVLPIGLNWNRTHGTGNHIALNNVITLKKETTASLEILIIGDRNPGQEFFVDIIAKGVNNLFGLSFELVYTPITFIEPLSADPDSGSGNLLGDDLIFFPNLDKTEGKISIGLSRKAGQGGVEGSGLVTRIKVRMSPIAIISHDTTWLSLENVQANDPEGNSIEFDVTNVTLVPLVTDVETTLNNTIPDEFTLDQNFPNPFNPETIIQYQLPKSSQVRLVIYNLAGQQVATLINEQQLPGFYSVQWNGKDDSGRNVSSGVYLYRLETKEFFGFKKMFLLR